MAQYEELIMDSERYGTNFGLMLYYAGYNRKYHQFCKDAGISAPTLHRMLHNKSVSFSAFKKIMRALNCTEPGNIIHGYYKPYRNKPLNLKKARQVRLMSQAELAAAVDRSQQWITCVEAGRCKFTPEMHTKLAAALNINKWEYDKFWF